jgi:hypothetical protein
VVLWRLAAALVTGPVGFFAAGAIDFGAFAVATVRESIRKRLSA